MDKKGIIISAVVVVVIVLFGVAYWSINSKLNDSNARFEKIEKQLGGDTGEITFAQVVQFLVQAQQQSQGTPPVPPTEAPKK